MKRKFLEFTAIIVVCFFIACKKKAHIDEPKAFQPLEVLSYRPLDIYPTGNDPWVRAHNPNSSYDANGYFHNLGVDYILANIGTDSSHENLLENSLNFLGSQFGHNYQDSVSQLIPYRDAEAYFTIVDSLRRSAFQNAIAASGASSGVQTELHNLLDILTDTLDPDYTANYDTLKYRLMTWEAGVDQGSLSSADKEALLRSGSIARYSMLYWHNYDSVYVGSGNRAKWLKWLGWALVGASDAMGFWIGTMGCGPGCGAAIGAAGSTGAFVIFRGRGWEPF